MVEEIQQLSAAMAAGDAPAVEAFYRQYFDWMYWQARRSTGRDESFCLDVVQDAVLRVIRTVKAVESEPRFLGWLRLVVQTTAFDLLRSERRRKNREAMAGIAELAVDADSLQLDWLAEQMSALDPELVKIIELRFEQKWSLRKIGEGLGLSIGAVDGRLRRALKDIRLKAEDSPPPVGELVGSDVGVIASAVVQTAVVRTIVEVAPVVAAPMKELESIAVEAELVLLEDEAGAHDDTI